MKIQEAIKDFEQYIKDANLGLSCAQRGYNGQTEEYLQGRIDTLAQAVRYLKDIEKSIGSINEDELDGMAWCKAREEYIDDYREPYAEGFKAGCKEILKML